MVLQINTDFIHSNSSFNRLSITMFNAGATPDPEMPQVTGSDPVVTFENTSYKNVSEIANNAPEGTVQKNAPVSSTSQGDTYVISSKNIIIG